MVHLPPSVRVIVRGWLNCNQVVLLRESGNVLVDSGYHSHSARTLERVAAPEALGDAPLARLVNTHCHSDHIGGNAALIERYRCQVTIPAGEAPAIDEWSRQERWNAYVDQQTVRFAYDDTIAPGDSFQGGGLEWQCHAAPGHDMEALMFHEPSHGILMTGDALWSNGLGFVWPHEGRNPFIEAALATLDDIERLEPAIVIPGHGEPFVDVAAAIARARGRLLAFGADPRKTARHMMKVMFVFSLLHRGSLQAAQANAYVRAVPCYTDLNVRFVGEDPETLGERIAAELMAAGALRLDGASLFPTMAA
jgi:glyoxylase-like metal-dependent hydrolase (beta-lactamase superfamily II)